MKTVAISLGAGAPPVAVPAGTPRGGLLPAAGRDGLPFVAALFNNEVVSLRAPVQLNGTLCGLTMADADGRLVFQRTACMILAMAAARASCA